MSILNGRLVASLLSLTSNGHRLRKPARNSYERLNAAFKARFGDELKLTQGYRTYAQQESIFRIRYRQTYATIRQNGRDIVDRRGPWQGSYWWRYRGAAAAVPGTSNHGLGLAIDISTGIGFGSFTSAQFKWLAANGPRYGWTNTEGRSVNEPWHWVYEAKLDVMKPATRLAVVGKMGLAHYKEWQRQLGGIGVDGIFGLASKRRLQRRLNGKHGKGGYSIPGGKLKVDGIDGPATWRAVQTLINVWHARTTGAAKKFRLKQGPLKVDGIPGPRTTKALIKTLNAQLWK